MILIEGTLVLLWVVLTLFYKLLVPAITVILGWTFVQFIGGYRDSARVRRIREELNLAAIRANQ